jgi:hypothetical protein
LGFAPWLTTSVDGNEKERRRPLSAEMDRLKRRRLAETSCVLVRLP